MNFPNTPSVVQLLGLTPSAAVCDSGSSLLQPDVVASGAVVSSGDGIVNQSTASQVPVTSGGSAGTTAGLESAVVDSLPSSSSLGNTASVFAEAAGLLHPDAGGRGDADGGGSLSAAGDSDASSSLLYHTTAPACLQHAGGGDDLVGMSPPVTLLSSQTDAQLQELLRQQQWHVRLNQMMQLDALQQHQQQQQPVVIGADAATASLLWQQQHAANPTTVSFAFCNDQPTATQQQQQQQVLLQHHQQQVPATSSETKYDVPPAPVQTKPTAADGQQSQSPRQQKPRLIARGD